MIVERTEQNGSYGYVGLHAGFWKRGNMMLAQASTPGRLQRWWMERQGWTWHPAKIAG